MPIISTIINKNYCIQSVSAIARYRRDAGYDGARAAARGVIFNSTEPDIAIVPVTDSLLLAVSVRRNRQNSTIIIIRSCTGVPPSSSNREPFISVSVTEDNPSPTYTQLIGGINFTAVCQLALQHKRPYSKSGGYRVWFCVARLCQQIHADQRENAEPANGDHHIRRSVM